MALTLRSNGVGGGLVNSGWWNDYYNLLTGVMTDQPVVIANHLQLTGGNNHIKWGGMLGINTDGDVIDASQGALYLKSTAGQNIVMQNPNGTSIFAFKSGTIEVQNWLGIRTFSGTKLGEFKGNGNLVIGGGTFQSAGGSVSTGAGGSFDSFDVAEIFHCDKPYPKGTVVCPGPNDKLTQCTHDNCHAAMILSETPGLGLGVPDAAEMTHYVALAGRVNALSKHTITPKQLLVSDGTGGVRPVNYGEPSFVLGFALNNSTNGQVGMFLRSIFVLLKQAS